jgi:hypothetical protein
VQNSTEVQVPMAKNSVGSWQIIAMALSAFTFNTSTPQADTLRLRWTKSGQADTHAGIYLDYIKLEGGIVPPVVATSVELTGEVLASGQTGTPFNAIINEGEAVTTLNDTDTFFGRVIGVLKKITWANIKSLLKTYFDTLYVALTGDQTVAGVKTFSSFPVTPSEAPTTDYQVANKKYVDDNAGGGGYEPKNSIEVDTGELQLVGDELAPGNNKVYGTDGTGAKGWKDDPAGGSTAPEYYPIPVFTYDNSKVIQTKKDIGGGKFIESRVAHHTSGDNIGKVDFIEIKDERTDPAIWVRETCNYTNKVLTSTTVADIVAWTITI